MCAAVFPVSHDSIEGRAAWTRRDGHGVHVQFYGNYTAFVMVPDLIAHGEDQRGVHTVAEQYGDAKVVGPVVGDLTPVFYRVGVDVAYTEGDALSADNIHHLALPVAVFPELAVVVYCDVVVAGDAGVEVA